MTNPMMSNPLSLANPMFKLEYPQSLGTFTSYADAQRAVDALADRTSRSRTSRSSAPT